MTKPRTGIPGAKGLSQVVNEEAWGADKAQERTRDYRGPGNDVAPPKPDTHSADWGSERPFMHVQGRARDFADDVSPGSYLRGGSKQAAEGKPGFDRRSKDGKPAKW